MRTCIYATLIAALIILAVLGPAWLESVAHGRNYCPPPPQAELVRMRGTGYCPRVPTVPLPYCPAP